MPRFICSLTISKDDVTRLFAFSEGGKGGAQNNPQDDEITPARLNLKVGKILSVDKVRNKPRKE